ncbi:hypothetical protein F5H01DRAFT_347850 [Linnemannia elongata]|nr:hypothetical protein F5H01DRAFT_347850 [Linnemannia elongata]
MVASLPFYVILFLLVVGLALFCLCPSSSCSLGLFSFPSHLPFAQWGGRCGVTIRLLYSNLLCAQYQQTCNPCGSIYIVFFLLTIPSPSRSLSLSLALPPYDRSHCICIAK